MSAWSWRGLRQRAIGLVGAFVALALGAALMTGAALVLRSALSATSADSALAQAGALLVILAVIGAFVTVFIVASTFAFSVAQRRRELARLRLIGATPRQVATVVRVEALTVAVAAGLVGGLCGRPAVTALLWLMSRFGVVPADTRISVPAGAVAVAAGIAAGAGCLVALLGASAAARRAARVAPAEALRDAASDQRVMTPGRWVSGALAAAASCGMLVLIPLAPPDGRMPLALFVALPLVVALAMLAPLLIPPVTGVLVAPVARWSAASGGLARQNMRHAVRRTASTAAPVLVLVGVAGSLLAGTQLLAAANAADNRLLYTSDLVAHHIAPTTVAAVPGVGTASRVLAGQATVYANRTSRRIPMLGVDPAAATDLLGLGRVDGTLSGMHGANAALSRSAAARYGSAIGDRLAVRLPDGTTATCRVVALFDGPPLSAPLLLGYRMAAAHTARPSGAVHIAVQPGGSRADVAARIAALGGTVEPTGRFLTSMSNPRDEGMHLGALVLATFAAVYTLIAIANTTAMSFTDRFHEFVRLRVVGAHRAQILRMVLWEALTIAGTGLVFGAAATAVSAGGLWAVFHAVGLAVPLTLPWPHLALIAATAVAVVAGTALIPAAVLTRRRYHHSDLTT